MNIVPTEANTLNKFDGLNVSINQFISDNKYFLKLEDWMKVFYKYLNHEDSPDKKFSDVARLATLATWRYTKGIYVFDDALFNCLVGTPLNTVPIKVLRQIKEWCVYLSIPANSVLTELPIDGVYVLFTAASDKEYILLSFTSSTEIIFSLPLVLPAADIATVDQLLAYEDVYNDDKSFAKELTSPMATAVSKILNLLLYINSGNAELKPVRGVGCKPVRKKTKRGLLLFPVAGETVYRCGDDIGKLLEQSKQIEVNPNSIPRPRKIIKAHIRRGHWHYFPTGPRSAPIKTYNLHWIPPKVVRETSVE